MKYCRLSTPPGSSGLCTTALGKKQLYCSTTRRRPCPYRRQSQFFKLKRYVQGEVIPRTVEVPEWVPLLVIEKICAAVLPNETVSQCSRRERD